MKQVPGHGPGDDAGSRRGHPAPEEEPDGVAAPDGREVAGGRKRSRRNAGRRDGGGWGRSADRRDKPERGPAR